MKLVILGLGYSAGFVAQAALAHGWEVTATRRAPAPPGASGPGTVRLLPFDGLSAGPELVGAIAAADALLVSIPPGPDGDHALAALGSRIAAAPRLGWIGYLSTVGVYGDHGGAWVDEGTPCQPSPRLRQRRASEAGWLALAAGAGKTGQVFRLSGIYGPGRNALVKLRQGRAQRLVKPGQVFNRIHVDDIADILFAAMARPRAGAIYNVTDDLPAPPQDVIAFAAALMGVEAPPEIPYDAAALSPMAASFYAENRRVSNALVKRELGYRFRYPSYREALVTLWREMG